MSEIPLTDLAAQHAEVASEITEGMARVMESSGYILGEPVAAFEAAFADFCETAHCVGVGSGTDALELILRALDIGHGDEVILPANSFIATALAVARSGATPVLVDCDPQHMLIDPSAVEGAIGERTKAIIPVHLFGQVAPMERLRAVAEARGLPLVEDAAQSQGARRAGQRSGSLGLAAATSFYPGKNLGAYGDAGAVTTDDPAIAQRIRALRNYGSDRKYYHPERGFNSRLDTLQAVVLACKLKRLDHWNELRTKAARRYDELLRACPQVRCPETMSDNTHIFHIYSVRVTRRDEVLQSLHNAGIGAGVHYPIPIHLSGAFRDLGLADGAFPHTEAAAKEMISLPIHPHLSETQQERVVDVLVAALSGG